MVKHGSDFDKQSQTYGVVESAIESLVQLCRLDRGGPTGADSIGRS